MRKDTVLKNIKRGISLAIVLCLVLSNSIIGVSAFAAEAETFTTELSVARAFADRLKAGEDSMRINVPQTFDYALCYQYLMMLYRDAYAFEYVPSYMNSLIKITYIDKAKHQQAEEYAAVLANGLFTDGMSERDKYYAIYEYLRDNVEYDMHAAMNQATETSDAFSAYGVFFNNLAVCDGLSSAFAMVCRYAGLPCLYVASPEMNHSWNIVYLDGEVRYLDVTYELSAGTKDSFFLLTEAEFEKDYSWDKELYGRLTSDIWDVGFESAYTLNQLGGMFRGSDKGWELDRNPTRAEAAIMMIRFLGVEDKILNSEVVAEMPFTDVNPNHAPYISALFAMGLTNGTSETTFTPDREVTLGDYMTFMLRALGYSEAEDMFAWESAPEDALGLGVIDQMQYDLLTTSGFDRGRMAFVSLAILTANDVHGTPLYERLSQEGVFDIELAKKLLF